MYVVHLPTVCISPLHLCSCICIIIPSCVGPPRCIFSPHVYVLSCISPPYVCMSALCLCPLSLYVTHRKYIGIVVSLCICAFRPFLCSSVRIVFRVVVRSRGMPLHGVCPYMSKSLRAYVSPRLYPSMDVILCEYFPPSCVSCVCPFMCTCVYMYPSCVCPSLSTLYTLMCGLWWDRG